MITGLKQLFLPEAEDGFPNHPDLESIEAGLRSGHFDLFTWIWF
jgi:hypothetical protein